MNPSEAVVCPRLEFVFIPRTDGEEFDIEDAIHMAAMRASRGRDSVLSGPLMYKTNFTRAQKHVLHVECDPDVGGTSGDSGGEG